MNYQQSIIARGSIVTLQGLHLDFVNPNYRTKFNYALAKNKRQIQEHLETLGEVQKADPLWVEYNNKRIALCEKYADKDKNEKPILDKNGNYVGLNGKPAFEKEIETIREEYKDHLHEDDIAIDFYKIKEVWLPVNDAFVGWFTETIFELIEWEDKDEAPKAPEEKK
jgi:hypothetical protein